ncbi:nuclear transport factor 2 family protein [Rhizobium laguerreae]|nr:nuclear transport factor 2 family protein [Rhizobium laguerreae]
MPLTRLIDMYCAAWSAETAQQRRALLLSVWSDGATYTDPTVHAIGAEELLVHIAGIKRKHPGAQIRRTSNVDVHHDVARFAWKFEMPDGSSLPEGLDIAVLDAEQKRLTRIIGFFGLLRPT